MRKSIQKSQKSLIYLVQLWGEAQGSYMKIYNLKGGPIFGGLTDQTMTIKQAWWTGFLGLNTNILCTLSLFISSYISGGSAWRILIIP